MYFDNVNTRMYGINPALEPRIQYYNVPALKTLIARDTLVTPYEKIFGMFRVSKNVDIS